MFSKGFISVDIGSKNIKLVHGKFNGKQVEVYNFDIIDTPEDSIRDGKILNVDAIGDEIKKSIKKKKVNTNRIILNITGTNVITREIKIPKADDKEIKGILEFEAPQYFPVSLENYVLDYKVIEEVVENDNVFLRVLLAAAPESQVQDYMKLVENLKMDIISIDIPANSILKYVFYGYKEDSDDYEKEEFSVVDIGANTTMISIFSKGTLMFTRSLLKGSMEIDKLISNVVSIDYKESEEIKQKRVKLLVAEERDKSTEDEILLDDTIKPFIISLFEEVNKFIEFYNSRNYKNKVTKIYVYGGGSRLKGLENFINQYFSIPTSLLHHENRVLYKKKDKGLFHESYLFLINAIGSMIR